MVLLDYGSSSGLMTMYFGSQFRRAIGVDVDKTALALASARCTQSNVTFLALNSEETMFRDASFDVVVANQVYNFVNDPGAMFREIYRVLRPGGICFLGARNKYALVEPQYRLPFLSMLPARLAVEYLRLFRGTSTFVGSGYLSRRDIRRLASRFRIRDYTIDILKDPEAFGYESLAHRSRALNLLPLERIVGLIPNYIMVLEKPAG
jgi:SAM-dependent methyltransferase